MSSERLTSYRRKRDFATTSEPSGSARDATTGGGAATLPRFVIQEHHATRLHWDLRLEHARALASWAIPNGIPPTPSENRLAVRTEDHPLEYLDFEGEIPKGQYGAGTMRIWDRGTFELHKWEPGKVELTFHGERLQGRYGLFPIGRTGQSKSDWMIHRMDPAQDPARGAMPERIVPMAARLSASIPQPEADWSFEVKWDGVRALAYVQPGRLRLESRNLREITDAYPEVRGLLLDIGMREAVLDGEIVAFDDAGQPSFERLQHRMHVTSASAVRRLARSNPVVYAVFDVLFLDGHLLTGQPYRERRAALESLELNGPAWRVPAAHPGTGRDLLRATAAQGLEGVVAKRMDSCYEPGRRSGAWRKLKHTLRQELVIGGWLPGEGRRSTRIGALLMGYYAGGDFRYAGRVGTGFAESMLDELTDRLQVLRRSGTPFSCGPKLPRDAIFVEPCLVAEVEFRQWTSEGVMRAPSFKGLREDKRPRDVVPESPSSRAAPDGAGGGSPAHAAEALFDEVEQLPDSSLAVLLDGRRLKLSNWEKVLYPESGFTKGELIAYYISVSDAVLPHLHDRALTLKRYPGGVGEPYFYEKQSPSHRPGWVATSEVAGVNYTLAQDRPTLVWLANLADIELHTSLSLAGEPQRPTMLVFDLDPGAPAGILECCEVGLVLHGLFVALGLQSFAKTSGSKGLQIYLPLNTPVEYESTKPFARRIAELLEQRMPELVVSRMTKRLRPGKVLVDWSQNDAHKTTVTVYSIRARERPTVSTPVSWQEVADCREHADGSLLSFDTTQVIERVRASGDLFAPVLSLRQRLPALS
ncbi:MAG: DNA ligase D [Solirubrobacteraceae bacterium]